MPVKLPQSRQNIQTGLHPKVLPELHAAKNDSLTASVVEDSLEMIQQYIKSA